MHLHSYWCIFLLAKTACPKGYHGLDLPGQAQCEACVSGTYSDASGATASGASVCSDCGAGKYSGETAGDSSAVCKACEEGTYNLQQGT